MNKEYSTILILVLGFVAFYIFSEKIIFLYVSLGTGIVSLVVPWVAKNLHFLWMKLSLLLGSVSSAIILTVIFFAIIVPLSFIARLSGKRFLVLKRREDSYFKPRNLVYDKESIENVW